MEIEKINKLWAEATSFSDDMHSRCILTTKKDAISLYKKWDGITSKVGDIQAFGTAGFMRSLNKTHKLEPCGNKYIMLL